MILKHENARLHCAVLIKKIILVDKLCRDFALPDFYLFCLLLNILIRVFSKNIEFMGIFFLYFFISLSQKSI